MDNQEDIVNFQTMFNGPFPFTTDGVIVGIPVGELRGGDADEDHLRGRLDRHSSLGTFNHENMHQWFGDNVSEAAFNLTFWKEGLATLGEYLATARTAATAAGGLGTPAGDAAFEHEPDQPLQHELRDDELDLLDDGAVEPDGRQPVLEQQHVHAAGHGLPRAAGTSSASPGWISAMKDIQSTYGGGNITEPQLEAVFHKLAARVERVVQRAARPVLHAVVRHRVPERRGEHDEQAGAHRPRR